MAGRKPKPTAMKALHGNPGKRPLNKEEPKYGGTTQIPSWVPKGAKEEFERITLILGDLDMLKATDQAALEAYCVAYAAWRQAEERLEKDGEVVKEIALDRHNNPIRDPENNNAIIYRLKRHPMSVVAKDRMAAMLRAASLFGFDPSSRSRVQIPEGAEVPDEDEDDAHLLGATGGFNSSRNIH
jgi:P27 family predicted phage terminase small subunit